MQKETWVILGASSYVSREFVKIVAKNKNDIIIASRNLEDAKNIENDIKARFEDISTKSLKLDICEFNTHDNFIKKCLNFSKKPINIFCAIGYMQDQQKAHKNFDIGKKIIDTNYTGIASILSKFTPYLEKQKTGSIVIMSSVAGDRGRPSNFLYGSAKAGLNTYLEGLRAQLAKSNISVTTVKAGFLDTKMTWGLKGLFLVASPYNCAKACYKYAKNKKDIKYFPFFWWGIMKIIKNIPEIIFKKLNL